MTHTPARRGCPACDETNNRFCNFLLYNFCGFFFCTSPDLSDQHNSLCLFVLLEQSEYVHEIGTYNGITADSNASGLTKTPLSQLPDGLIGERSAAGNDAH